MRIRPARPEDVELILRLIRELADYERAPEKVRATSELLHRWLFAADRAAEAIIAEAAADLDQAGRPQALGFALFYQTFSTWEGVPGLWLEDLYVPPEHRRGGVGQALLEHVAALAVERGFTRLEWTVLTWNEPALDFYAQLGAERLEEWRTHRLDGETLARAARGTVRPEA